MTDLHPKIPGKYRCAFDWRVSHGNLHSLATDTAVMVRVASSDFPDILKDFLEVRNLGCTCPTSSAPVGRSHAAGRSREALPETPGLQKTVEVDTPPMIKSPADTRLAKREQSFHRLNVRLLKKIANNPGG